MQIPKVLEIVKMRISAFRAVSLSAFLAVFLMTSLVLPAVAEEDGWYLRAQGGGNFADDPDIWGTGGTVFNRTSDIATGYVAGAALGRAFGKLRLEGEFLYRRNGLDALNGVSTGVSGDRSVRSATANLLYDIYSFEAYPDRPFDLYAGFGLGVARVSLDDVTEGGAPLVDDSDSVFAYQALAGIRHRFAPQWSVNLDYRYFATERPEFGLVAGGTVKSDVEDHSVLFGITWHFGVPAKAAPAPATPSVMPVVAPALVPAPAPAPAAPEKKTFLVFFDWDKSDIRPDAAAILTEAATAAKGGALTVVLRLVGHADRSGPRPYNQRLSEHRALAVKDFLVSQGLSADVIATLGKGEDDPLVATPDGVREPRNRRVEIALP